MTPHETIEKLRRDNAALHETVAQLTRVLMDVEIVFPRAWRLVEQEALLLRCLINNKLASRDMLFQALYWGRHDDELPAPKIVDTTLCKLRKKLKGLGVVLEIEWGRGWFLSDTAKAEVRRLAARGAT